jgi:prolyl-tRNA editing enzyme YbaK/EbsC (Cys-tRNA(Pro) deacylase)
MTQRSQRMPLTWMVSDWTGTASILDRSRYRPGVHPTAARTQKRLTELGLDVEVIELDESTRTAAEAARAVGCDVAQIVKSLVLVSAGGPLLCLCAGDRRVDLAPIGSEARMATADEARAATGFAVGGVPPLGHDNPVRTIVDASLERYDEVWCAAGTPRAVFRVPTAELIAAIPDAVVSTAASRPA